MCYRRSLILSINVIPHFHLWKIIEDCLLVVWGELLHALQGNRKALIFTTKYMKIIHSSPSTSLFFLPVFSMNFYVKIHLFRSILVKHRRTPDLKWMNQVSFVGVQLLWGVFDKIYKGKILRYPRNWLDLN